MLKHSREDVNRLLDTLQSMLPDQFDTLKSLQLQCAFRVVTASLALAEVTQLEGSPSMEETIRVLLDKMLTIDKNSNALATWLACNQTSLVGIDGPEWIIGNIEVPWKVGRAFSV